jgi:dual specificity phosphatase 12
VVDDPETDLLGRLPPCLEFIEQALKAETAILVHCLQGVSRSAMLVMAHIMATQDLDCPKAFRVLKKKHKPSCPNEGFRVQLKLFGNMGGVINVNHPEYVTVPLALEAVLV